MLECKFNDFKAHPQMFFAFFLFNTIHLRLRTNAPLSFTYLIITPKESCAKKTVSA